MQQIIVRYILIRPLGSTGGHLSSQHWHRVEWDGTSSMDHHVLALYPQAFRAGSRFTMDAIVDGERVNVASYGERYVPNS